MSKPSTKEKPKSLAVHLIAGGGAGLVEALICHPLDTIKVRMQLRGRDKNVKKLGPLSTAFRIASKEGGLALYKGLGAVVSGIVPKMAIRFWSFEAYKDVLKGDAETANLSQTFFAGLLAGITESYAVVNPFDVIKIRLQAQRHSLADPLDIPKYRSAPHAAYTIVREEGIMALYKGATLTAARQATNQAVNFSVYQELKKLALNLQNVEELSSWQHLILGGVSGGLAPCANAPIDTIKTKIQKQGPIPGLSGMAQIRETAKSVYRNEGFRGFYNGLTPRLMRVAPGQAITFMVYEKIRLLIAKHKVEGPLEVDVD